MIEYEEINKTIEYLETRSETEIQEFVNKMSKEQPYLLAYLMASGKRDDLFDQYEAEIILFVGVILWQLVKESYRPLPKVKDRILDKAEKQNENFLEILSSDSQGDFLSVVNSLVKTYPEPELLCYIIESIFDEEDPDDSPIHEENAGLAFFYLKTALDALLMVAK